MNIQEYISQLRRNAAEQNPDALLAFSEREWESIEPHLTIEDRHAIGGLVEWALTVKDLDDAEGQPAPRQPYRAAGAEGQLPRRRVV